MDANPDSGGKKSPKIRQKTEKVPKTGREQHFRHGNGIYLNFSFISSDQLLKKYISKLTFVLQMFLGSCNI